MLQLAITTHMQVADEVIFSGHLCAELLANAVVTSPGRRSLSGSTLEKREAATLRIARASADARLNLARHAGVCAGPVQPLTSYSTFGLADIGQAVGSRLTPFPGRPVVTPEEGFGL